MVTLVPFVIALGVLLTVGLAPFVGPFALLVSLVGLLTCVLWKAVADVLALRSESVFRLAKTTELLGRGGPDDPDWMLVPRQRRPRIQAEPLQRDVAQTESGGPTELRLTPLARPPLPTQATEQR